MKNRKNIGNALLILTLLAATASYAEETTTPAPQHGVNNGQDVRSPVANMTHEQREKFMEERRERIQNMTPEQREALKAKRQEKLASMTPEQREALKERHREHRAERMEHRAERMERHADRPGK